jgi:outer membrane protein
MKRTVVICLGAMLIVSKVYGQNISPAKLTLKQCIETGIANNFDVQQRQLLAQSDKAVLQQSKMNMLPDLNAFASHNFSQGRSIDPYTNSPVTEAFNSSNYSVSSNVVLFNGFAIQNNIKRNSLAYQASTMEWQQAKDNLTINIILAYLQVLSSTDQLEQAKNQLALSSTQLNRLEILNKEGAIRPADLTDLKGQSAGDQLAIINAQNSLEIAKISLCRWMNTPYDKNITLERIEPSAFTARYETEPGIIYQTALKQLALIKAVDLRRQSAGKAVKVERGQLFPRLSFGASASTRYVSAAMQSQYINTVYAGTSDSAVIGGTRYPVYSYQDKFTSATKISYRDQLNNNLNTSFGFSLNIPIFNSMLQRTRLKQARNNLRIAELNAKTTRTQLGQDIDAAYINMASASDRYKVLQEQASAYNESFRSAGILFQQGVSNSYEYLTSKNNFDRANINLIIAKYDYVLRTKILDYYQGKQLW